MFNAATQSQTTLIFAKGLVIIFPLIFNQNLEKNKNLSYFKKIIERFVSLRTKIKKNSKIKKTSFCVIYI